ncbi:MAG: hypothetical protein H0Z29_12020 [Candidatus Marinimicrobia bacterium]|nr:hypothetical protein [Candidatus Neomarinimicrobiota bacterium]
MNEIILVTSIVCLIGMILSAWVTNTTMKNIGKFGDDAKGKRLVSLKHLFNFYAILILSFVLLTRALNFIKDQLFVALLVAVIGGLGFKISHDVFTKNSSQ